MSGSGQQFLIALGGNMQSAAGDPHATLSAALSRLAQLGCRIDAISGFYETPCFPAGAGPDYVNAAATVTYEGTPHEFLVLLNDVEAAFGRERVQRWGQRTLDLDLIAAGDQVLPDPETQAAWRDLPLVEQIEKTPQQLIVPHPRMQDRAFVLVPLADVAPDWVHPLLGRDVRTMRDALPRTLLDEVKPL